MPDIERDLNVHRTRFKILKHMMDHDASHPFVSLERAELIEELGLFEMDVDEAIKYLEENMLVETVWFMGGDFWTKISSYGIEEIDKLERNPDMGTKCFPPAKLIC